MICLVGELEKQFRLKNISLLDLSKMSNITYKVLEQFNNDLYNLKAE